MMIRQALTLLGTVGAALLWAPAQDRAQDRPKAPFHVLFSNDFTNIGSCTSPYHKRGQRWRPEMLEATVDETAGTAVDVHMLQPCMTWVPWWPSRVYPLQEHHRWWKEYFGVDLHARKLIPAIHQYILDGGNPLKVFIARCRAKGQRAFISLRLNDGHHLQFVKDAHNTKAISCISKFYAEHPEYRIGPDLNNWDQHVHNWAIPEARAYKLALIKEICTNYDIDGLELDFMRHPSYFRQNETTSAQRRKIMTDFVAEVRKALDAGAKSGRRRWLCARVPSLLSWHDRLGIDLPSLHVAGLDMVNVSAHYFTQQHHDLAKIRKLVPGAAVYLEMCHCTMTGQAMGPGIGDIRQYTRTTDQQYYTTAHVAYRRGADGVSLFNFVYYRQHGHPGRGPFNEPPFDALKHLADRQWLARQPQWYVLAKAWQTPMPKRFTQGQTHTLFLDMAPTEHQQKEGLLRLRTERDSAGGRFSVKLGRRPCGSGTSFLVVRCMRRMTARGS